MTKEQIKESIEMLECEKASLQSQINALEDGVDKIRKKLNGLEDALWLIELKEDEKNYHEQPILVPTVDEFFKLIQNITFEYSQNMKKQDNG